MSTAARNHWLKPQRVSLVQFELDGEKYQCQRLTEKLWRTSRLRPEFAGSCNGNYIFVCNLYAIGESAESLRSAFVEDARLHPTE